MHDNPQRMPLCVKPISCTSQPFVCDPLPLPPHTPLHVFHRWGRSFTRHRTASCRCASARGHRWASNGVWKYGTAWFHTHRHWLGRAGLGHHWAAHPTSAFPTASLYAVAQPSPWPQCPWPHCPWPHYCPDPPFCPHLRASRTTSCSPATCTTSTGRSETRCPRPWQQHSDASCASEYGGVIQPWVEDWRGRH